MCESLYKNESTTFKDVDVRLTTGNRNVARLYLGTRYISLKLEELRYLCNMFYIITISKLCICVLCPTFSLTQLLPKIHPPILSHMIMLPSIFCIHSF
jgi:hypothetical protein